MSKEKIKEREKQLIEMVGEFSKKHINDEYKELSIKLVKKLGRKHNVPFERGKLEIWATGIIYALAQINFLFDKSFEPYISTDELCDYFETKKSTVADKARKIREMLKMSYYDKEFSTKHMYDNNPYNKYVMSDDGFIVPKSMLNENNGSKNIFNLIAENSDFDEETIKSSLIADFIKKHGNEDLEELNRIIEVFSQPIPKDKEEEFLNLLLGQGQGDTLSLFDKDDDIETFEDYVIDETNPLETIDDYQRAIDLFRDTKGEDYFKEFEGTFWLLKEARPFMTHLLEQATMLWDADEKDKAIDQLFYMLTLNNGDNQGVRYILINKLLELNRLDEVNELINFFDEEYSAIWEFSKLLFAIKSKKDKKTIKKLYEEAVDTNEFVVPFLLGEKFIPNNLPSFYSFGDENEGIIYVDLGFKPWNDDKIAIKTLKKLYSS